MTGKVFYCLQYGRRGKHVSKYVPADEPEAYREATENYRLFMEAVDNYIEERSAATAEEISRGGEVAQRERETKGSVLLFSAFAALNLARSARTGESRAA